jgi:membrane-associated phospholipid phosphatase
MALIAAAAGAGLLIATWFCAFHIGFVERADRSILDGFTGLHRPELNSITRFITRLCDPHPYVFLAAIPVVAAILRRRPRVAVTVGLIMLGANMTTQLLKPLLAAPRWALSGHFVTPHLAHHSVQAVSLYPASWPSGHATAAMSLALCAVIAAPARLRPTVGAAMAAFTLAVCYSFLELAWHFPSDVLGGFLVATIWTLLGVAGLWWLEARRVVRRRELSPAGAAQFSVAEAVAPMGVLVLGALLLAAVIALARPHAVVAYASTHTAFIVGAALIAVVGVMLATAATLVLRRG